MMWYSVQADTGKEKTGVQFRANDAAAFKMVQEELRQS